MRMTSGCHVWAAFKAFCRLGASSTASMSSVLSITMWIIWRIMAKSSATSTRILLRTFMDFLEPRVKILAVRAALVLVLGSVDQPKDSPCPIISKVYNRLIVKWNISWI